MVYDTILLLEYSGDINRAHHAPLVSVHTVREAACACRKYKWLHSTKNGKKGKKMSKGSKDVLARLSEEHETLLHRECNIAATGI